MSVRVSERARKSTVRLEPNVAPQRRLSACCSEGERAYDLIGERNARLFIRFLMKFNGNEIDAESVGIKATALVFRSIHCEITNQN